METKSGEVFLVSGCTGERDDYREWQLCAFYNQEQALEFADRLTKLSKSVKKYYGNYKDSKLGLELLALDPNALCHGDPAKYVVTKLDIFGLP